MRVRRRESLQSPTRSPKPRLDVPQDLPDTDVQRLHLQPGEVISLIGKGECQVLKGALLVQGRHFAEGSAFQLCADAGPYGPALIEGAATASEVQVPLAAEQAVELELSSVLRSKQSRNAIDEHLDPPLQQYLTTLHLPTDWQQTAAAIAAASAISDRAAVPTCIAVCGAKGTGKSTWTRFMLNSLLNHHHQVAYLDTDCGQPELNPPGLLALHLLDAPLLGRPHTHQRSPDAAVFVGALSCDQDPERYLAAVMQLYRQHASMCGAGRPCPLVVNTHGWIKGLGFDVLAAILRATCPTHVIVLKTGANTSELPTGNFWHLPGVSDVHAWDQAHPGHGQAIIVSLPALPIPEGSIPAVNVNSGLISKRPNGPENRERLWLAFARACVQAQPEPLLLPDPSDFSKAAAALAAQPPYVISLDAVQCKALHDPTVPAEDLPAVLNGAVVGLIAGQQAAQAHQPGIRHRRGGQTAAAAEPGSCLGLGIVRAVDRERRLLYLLTPLPLEQLQAVTDLHAGSVDLPPSLLFAPGLQSPYLAPWCISNIGTGAARMQRRTDILRVSHQPQAA